MLADGRERHFAALGRADLLRCLRELGPEGLETGAEFIGFYRRQPEAEISLKLPDLDLPPATSSGSMSAAMPSVPESGSQSAHFFRVVARENSELVPEVPAEATEIPRPLWYQATADLPLQSVIATGPSPPPKEPLSAWSRVWPFLRRALSNVRPTSRLDLKRLVDTVATAQFPSRIPRQSRLRWETSARILLDRNERVFPFNRDFTRLLEQLEALRGKTGLEIQTLLRNPGGAVLEDGGHGLLRAVSWKMPPPTTPILILSDLGLLDKTGAAARQWLAFGRRLQAAGGRPLALLPVSVQTITADIAVCFQCFNWDRHSRFQPIQPAIYLANWAERSGLSEANAVETLLALLSPALRVEPALLRAVRHLLPAREYDVGIEAAVWAHEAVEATPLGIYFRQDAVERYHRKFAEMAKTDSDTVAQVCKLIIQYHAHAFPTQRYEEIATLARLTGQPMDGLAEEAVQHMMQLTKALDRHLDHAGLAGWGDYHLAKQDASAWRSQPYVHALWGILQRREAGDVLAIPDGIDLQKALPFLLQPQEPQTYVVRQRGQVLEVLPEVAISSMSGDAKVGSILTHLQITSGEIVYIREPLRGESVTQVLKLAENLTLQLPLRHDVRQHLHAGGERITIESLTRPAWAIAIGNDSHGLYAESRAGERLRCRYYWHPPRPGNSGEVLPGCWYPSTQGIDPPPWANSRTGWDAYGVYADLTLNNITQRFRWIQPGAFLMGSPESEAERDDDETQHEVVLTQGFWLADSACTQALWRAVMGENPSRFQEDENNPVEQVSWHDVQGFLETLNRAIRGLNRPRRRRRRAARNLETLNRAISGLNARLPSEAEWEYACRAGTTTPFFFGEQITPEQVNYNGDYPYTSGEKVYRQKTVPVKSLPANPWGLYEMHGNVWEWCEDWYGPYPTEPATDPTGPATGASRVLRGGSWNTFGRLVRCANRIDYEPHYHNDYIGFRLALGQTASAGPVADSARTAAPALTAAAERSGQGGRGAAEASREAASKDKGLLGRLKDWLKPQ